MVFVIFMIKREYQSTLKKKYDFNQTYTFIDEFNP